jgi:asparagine synthase (glutamine-hydrolysing)
MAILGFIAHRAQPDALAASMDFAARHAPGNAETRRTALAAGAGFFAAPSIHAGNAVSVAVQGTPRLAGASSSAAGTSSPAQAIHSAYLAQGPQFLATLLGPFAIVVHDESNERVLLAIDRMGVERLTYALDGERVLFGSSAELVAGFPGLTRRVRSQALYDFLMMHMIPAPQTVYEGVHKLSAASAVVIERGSQRVYSYWKPQFRERQPERFETLRDDLHGALEAAVRDCRPDQATGSFLSGGLDSSTVSGKLAQVAGSARTFSIGFGVEAYNEVEYAQIAARHFKCDAFEYHVTPQDIVAAFPLIARNYDEPFGNSSAVPSYFCALRARERGVTHLLAGDGGDEIFGGNERYARHKVFDAYFRIPRLLRRAIEPVAMRLPGRPKVLQKVRSYVEQARIPLPERLETWNFAYREGGTMLEPDFAAAIDPRKPFQLMDEIYAAAPCDSTLNKMLYYDWQLTLADNDLRKVNTMCELAGVAVSYPMLDARVVDLANRVTPDQKMAGLELRSFYKRAMQGFLPEQILRKTKHGFGLPFGDWLKTHEPLAQLIYGYLTDFKSRGIVRPRFLDELIESQRSGHASYYGYAIWDFAMLEGWLQAHAIPR